MELPAPLHIGPHAADEVGGGAVAQHVVFLHPLGHGGLKNLHQRGGQGDGLRLPRLHGGGDGLRGAEVVGLEVAVQQGVDVPEVVGVHLVFEFAGMVFFQGLDLLVGGQHLLELLRLQKALGSVFQLLKRLGKLGHGGVPPFREKRSLFSMSIA